METNVSAMAAAASVWNFMVDLLACVFVPRSMSARSGERQGSGDPPLRPGDGASVRRLHADVVQRLLELLDAIGRLATQAQLAAVGAEGLRRGELGGGRVLGDLLVELLLERRALLGRRHGGGEGRAGYQDARHGGADNCTNVHGFG